MAYRFDGKRAVVTGGSRGIGRAIVKALIDAGAEVFAIAKTQANLDQLKSDIPNVNIIAVDLANWEDTKLAVENIGDIDLVVNNAAALEQVDEVHSFVDTPKSKLDVSIDVNLKAAFNISQIAAHNMISRSHGGAIVNMSSVAGLKPSKGMGVYCISKAGMDMMTKVMALELGPHKIRVNTISPTGVLTESFVERMETFKTDNLETYEMINSALKRHPLGKFTDVEDIVNSTMFLLSEKASMITGTILPVDGGYMLI